MYAQAGLAALQLAGGYFASQNIKETAKLNRDIAEMNAEFAELDAYDALREGESQQARYQAVVESTMADQRVANAVNDVDVNYGTAAALVEESDFNAQMNMLEIQKQAEETALGYKTQARQIRLGGAMGYNDAQQRASSVMRESVMGAVKSGISGYNQYQSKLPSKS